MVPPTLWTTKSSLRVGGCGSTTERAKASMLSVESSRGAPTSLARRAAHVSFNSVSETVVRRFTLSCRVRRYVPHRGHLISYSYGPRMLKTSAFPRWQSAHAVPSSASADDALVTSPPSCPDRLAPQPAPVRR